MYCPGHSAPCSQVVSGTIVFTGYVQGSSAAGTYSLDLPDGVRLEGSFAGPYCDHQVMCG